MNKLLFAIIFIINIFRICAEENITSELCTEWRNVGPANINFFQAISSPFHLGIPLSMFRSTIDLFEGIITSIRFNLYTRKKNTRNESFFSVISNAFSSSIGKIFSRKEELFKNENKVSKYFDPDKETFFIVHGFTGTSNNKIYLSFKDAYLEHGDYNVIIVDYSSISQQFIYYQAAHRAVKVSEQVSETIALLIKLTKLDPVKITLIGYSLGGQIVGIIGNRLREKSHLVKHIIALDPAYPIFKDVQDVNDKINPKSALHVEVIHTNAGYFGYLERVGTLDFYVNGGIIQDKRCTSAIIPKFLKIPMVYDNMGTIYCSHDQSVQLFLRSLKSTDKIYGVKCKAYRDVFCRDSKCNGTEEAQLGGIKDLDSFGESGMYSYEF